MKKLTAEQELYKQLDRLVVTGKTPGVQYAATGVNRTSIRFHTGVSSFETNSPVTDATLFNICSVTKLFTSLAILQLVERKELQLIQPVSAFLGNVPAGDSISIQQLLSHTSGLGNPLPLNWVRLQHETFDKESFIQLIFRKAIIQKNKPDTRYRYSNINYLLFGLVIEKLSGIPYEKYIEQHIIRKINPGVDQLLFEVNTSHPYAMGYQKRFTLLNLLLGLMMDKGKYLSRSVNHKWMLVNPYYINGTAYGGLISNAATLVQFAGTLFSDYSPLIGSETRKHLLTQHLLADGQPAPVTAGWQTGTLKDQFYISHAGGGAGYYCELRYYPSLKLSTAIMLNRTGIRDERILDRYDCHLIENV